MSEPLISIIAPVYRVEALLGRCLDSVLQQIYCAFELILIDDGSPDGSGAICDRYAARDPRIQVIHQPNSGVGTARNAGLACARGALISFIDTDDFLAPGYLKNLVDAQRHENADLVIARFHRLSDADADRDFVTPPRGERLIPRADFGRELAEICEDTRAYTLWAKCYRRELLDGILYDPKATIGGDTVMMGEVLAKAQSIRLTDAADYYYCERMTGTITSQQNPEIYRGYMGVHARFCKSLGEAGYASVELDRVLNRRLARYCTRSIHTIRRGPWTGDERRRYVDGVLAQDPLVDAVRRENELNPQPEYRFILDRDSVGLLKCYEAREKKNAFARKHPHVFGALSRLKRILR